MTIPQDDADPIKLRHGLLLSDDLLFHSRITGTAAKLGLTLHTFRTADALLHAAKAEVPACVLLDLHNPGLDIAATVARLQAQHPRPVLIAYGSHVDVPTLRRARESGCDHVLPRSQFVEDLPRSLRAWFGALDKPA